MTTKYKIEGDIDFFSELYKSLDKDEDQIDETNICLITQEPLTSKYVELKCGHKFNYIPLYNDLINFKQKFNLMEGINTRLKNEEIRCPYCRKKQKELLPYYKEFGLKKINGVNYYRPTDTNQTHSSKCESSKCEFVTLNVNFNPLLPEDDDNKKFINCTSSFCSKIQIYNPYNPNEPINYGDNKQYCYKHEKLMIKQYKLKAKEEAKQKEKEEKLKAKEQAKQKAKEEKLKAKEEAKQKAKEEKLKAKEEAKQKAKEEKLKAKEDKKN
jgi:hypothetical protein